MYTRYLFTAMIIRVGIAAIEKRERKRKQRTRLLIYTFARGREFREVVYGVNRGKFGDVVGIYVDERGPIGIDIDSSNENRTGFVTKMGLHADLPV